MSEAYYPHVVRCPECGPDGLCPAGAILASEMIWLKCRRGHWKNSVRCVPFSSNAMPGKGVNPGTFPSVVAYWGSRVDRFRRIFSERGTVVNP